MAIFFLIEAQEVFKWTHQPFSRVTNELKLRRRSPPLKGRLAHTTAPRSAISTFRLLSGNKTGDISSLFVKWRNYKNSYCSFFWSRSRITILNGSLAPVLTPRLIGSGALSLSRVPHRMSCFHSVCWFNYNSNVISDPAIHTWSSFNPCSPSLRWCDSIFRAPHFHLSSARLSCVLLPKNSAMY